MQHTVPVCWHCAFTSTYWLTNLLYKRREPHALSLT